MQFASCTSDGTETDDLALVKTQLKRLEHQVTSLEQTVHQQRVDNSNLESHVIGLESQVTGLKQTLRQQRVDNSNLEHTVQGLKVDNTNLKRDNRIQLDQFKNDVDKLQQDFNTFKTGELRILLVTWKEIKCLLSVYYAITY